ncbi:Hydroxymethylpyrimidine ABC transporter, substrate-binding component [hydrothermal vent metagenome]|uniref:Hydroxymethylpyrimidine ABC transporter, substrate-binding component n=1 Tax=hydrothermal vent metagenome TaxID=652676 RepID=A0A3B1B398_9ZZZZ
MLLVARVKFSMLLGLCCTAIHHLQSTGEAFSGVFMNGFIRNGFFLCFFLLLACRSETQPPLRIGSNLWLGYEPVYLARELGYLSEDDVWLVEMRSASQVLELLASGNLEGGMLTLDETLTAVQHGVPLEVVAVIDISNGADVLLARPGIELNDLKGRRIGVENMAVGAMLLEGALLAAGLKVADVKLVPLEVSDHEAAYLQGKIDAVVTFEPTRTRLLKQGARQIFDSSLIPGQIVDVLAVRSDMNKREHQRQIRLLVAAYFKSLDYMRMHKREAAEHIAPRLHLSVDEVLDSYRGVQMADLEMNRKFLEHGELNSLAGRLQTLMLNNSLLNQAVDSHLANSQYLPGKR